MKHAVDARKFPEIDTRNPLEVKREVLRIFQGIFPDGDVACIQTAFESVQAAFAGKYPGYQAIDAKYHDFEHTLQGTLCFVRLLEGYHRAGAEPVLTRRMFELGTFAILLHDTGYLKKTGDDRGTGAKYTLTHVSRSAEFAAKLLQDQGFESNEIRSVQNMIRCTGVNADLRSIPFQSELERKMGFALGTADLLGQMAASDYTDKLSILFQEFEESNRYNRRSSGAGVFQSAADLRRKTPLFWQKYVWPKIQEDFKGLHRYLENGAGENLYLKKVEANIERLTGELEAVPA